MNIQRHKVTTVIFIPVTGVVWWTMPYYKVKLLQIFPFYLSSINSIAGEDILLKAGKKVNSTGYASV